MMDHVKTIFFDYDGTLHNSIKIYTPALNKAYQYLVEKGLTESKTWEDDELIPWLGYNSKEMWQLFMPHLDKETHLKASKIVGEEMIRQVEIGNARLYEGAIEILDYLKNKGYTLVFISNCNTYYKELHKNYFGLGQYFDRMIGSEEFQYIPKEKILKKVKNDYQPEMCMIGDREQDMIAGYSNNIRTIGCLYGYGTENELAKADIKIKQLLELKKYL